MKSIQSAFAILALFTFQSAHSQEPPPAPPVRTLAFSADGKLLAIGSGSRELAGVLMIWDVPKAQTIFALPQDRGISSLALSADGRFVAFAHFDRPPQLLEIATKQVIAVLPEDRRGPVAFSPDSKTLAMGCTDFSIALWDVSTRDDRQVLPAAKERPYGNLEFSSDGQLLVAACGSAGAYLWDLAAGQPKHILQLSRNTHTQSAAISPDGRWILAGGFDGTTHIWDTNSGELRARLGELGSVMALGYSAAAQMIATCSIRSEVMLLHLPLDEPSPEQVTHIRELFARFDNDQYEVRELASAELFKQGFIAEGELNRVATNSTSVEAKIRARRVREKILKFPGDTLAGHQARVWCLAFAPNGKLLASGSDDGTVRLWDVATRTEVGLIVPTAK